MTDDLERRLTQAGQRPTPDADAAFADGLEDRLRLMAADRARHPSRSTWWRPAGALVAAAAVVVTAVLVMTPSSDRAPLEVTVAGDAKIVLPDGTAFDGNRAIDLPDGTTIITGPDGSATIVTEDGQLVVGADQRVRIVDGRPEASPDPVSTTTTTEPVRQAPGDPTTTSVAPSTTVRDRPPADATTTTTSTLPPASTTTSTAPRDVSPLRLDAVRSRDGHVELSWSQWNGEFRRYVLLRAPAPADPVWPRADRTQVVMSTTDRARRHWIDAVERDVRVRYRLAVLDAQDRVVAESPVVEI